MPSISAALLREAAVRIANNEISHSLQRFLLLAIEAVVIETAPVPDVEGLEEVFDFIARHIERNAEAARLVIFRVEPNDRITARFYSLGQLPTLRNLQRVLPNVRDKHYNQLRLPTADREARFCCIIVEDRPTETAPEIAASGMILASSSTIFAHPDGLAGIAGRAVRRMRQVADRQRAQTASPSQQGAAPKRPCLRSGGRRNEKQDKE